MKKLFYHKLQRLWNIKFSITNISLDIGRTITQLLSKRKDNIDKSMECSETTLSLCLAFSKAFDTIDFIILIQKIHGLYFSKTFLRLICIIYEIKPILYKLIPTILLFFIEILVRVNFGISAFLSLCSRYERLLTKPYLSTICRWFYYLPTLQSQRF